MYHNIDAERDLESTDSSSDSSSGEEDSVLNPIDVRNFILPTVETLSNLLKKFPNIPHDQQKAWGRTVSRLVAQSEIPSYKIALLGKTGAGKSTLINCLLGHAILPSSAAGACTAVTTEIKYADTDGISAKILFKSKAEFEKEQAKLVMNANGTDDSPESFKSKEKLLMVYPQLRNKDITTLTPSRLLKLDPVQHRLGTSTDLPPSDADNFRTNLEEYLSAATGNKTTLWPLVSRVEVRGRFPVLSRGIILADLPGNGDDDDVRNNSADEYIKNAQGVILVTDIKRATNDRDTISYLRKTQETFLPLIFLISIPRLAQIIIDGHSIENFVVFAATGTDTLFEDNEIPLEKEDRLKLNEFNQDLKQLRQFLHPPKNAQEGKSKRGKQHHLSRPHGRVEEEIQEKQRAKTFFLANVRIASTRRTIKGRFEELYSELAPQGENEPPHLPMFCLGSQDYLVLESFSRTPSVFFDQDMTEIPQLREHLIAVGERRRNAWATDLFQRLEKFSENIHSYFSEGKHPGRLHQENKTKALALIDDLEKANLQAAKDAFDAVEQELNRIKEELQDATQQAATSSPQVMSRFSNMHWNTYKACMRFNGVYFAHDMNRDLTQKILPAIRGSWNGGINHRIPRIIRDTTLDLEENTLEKITEIISALTGKGTALKQPIDAARDSIGVEGLFSDMLTDAIEKITVAQRDGTRSFNTVLQQEMTPQYQHSFQQSGTGAFARMKTSNVSHLEEHGEAVFHSINMHIEKLLDDALAKVKHEFRTELHNLGILLRSSFVEKVDLSKDHQKVKDQIIQLTLEKRPAIATWKLDLSHQQHRSGAESKQ